MKPFMPNKDDRELDELFRKAAAAYVPEQAGKEDAADREAVWNTLEEQLNASESGSHRRGLFGWWFFYLGLFLLLALTGFFLWQNTSKKVDGTVKQVIPIPSENHIPPLTAKKDKNKTEAIRGNTSNRKVEEQKNTGASLTRPGRQTGSRGNIPVNPGRKTIVAEDNGIKESGSLVSGSRYLQLPSLQSASFQGQLTPKAPEKMTIHSSIINWNADVHVRRSKMDATDSNEKDSKTEKEEQPGYSRWLIGFTAGPAWTGVKTRGWKTGIAGGLELTYQLNSKWAISTGVLLSKILYNAAPEDYHPKDNSWQNYNVQQIRAKCIILNVPLNVEYTLWNDHGNAIFLSTGLSSFWMQDEQYTYRYKTQTGSLKQWTKELYNQNHHLFSILNFSAGYQKDWRRLSLQVAPYLQVPLKGIGYGRVKLYGAGVHFTLQYRLK